jgi:hypothetical protein
MDCKVMFWLGKAVFNPNYTVNYFIGVKEGRNWQEPDLNRVLWKMLADHAGHSLRVLVEWTPELNEFMENERKVDIGGDEPGQDISIEEYLKDWDG